MNSSMMSHIHCIGSSTLTGPSESVRHVENPQEKREMMRRTKDVVEQIAVILVRVEAVLNVDVLREARVEVTEVELPVRRGQKRSRTRANKRRRTGRR